MKRLNLKKTILEKGGLMIEALAMLGLIAVVTPTMYKKSAERTMEVDDINAATTIRTIMNAADSYVASNYTTLLSTIGDGSSTTIENSRLTSYLPYGFDLDHALYNYSAPVVGLRRDGNNLTAFVLFPAKADEETGLGRERTARIAALIGSNGGYVTEENKARGVGGIWKLEGGDFSSVFSESPNVNSIVTASSEAISSSVLSELDNPKYLQRGIDDGESASWKNAMRADLYMGGKDDPEDIYTDSARHSIRNIESLIVGAEEAAGGNYGLYITESDTNSKPNAFISGSITAAKEKFFVDEDNLSYGDAGTDAARKFNVGKAGNVLAQGTLTNWGNINLASKNGHWTDILIGALTDNADASSDSRYIIKAGKDGARNYLSLLDPKIVYIADNDSATGTTGERVSIMSDSSHDYYVKSGSEYQKKEVEDVKYNNQAPEPSFPVRIGSNAKVRGVLAAGMVDTNKIRTASISVGSEHINDEYQWMTVDKDGVMVGDPNHGEQPVPGGSTPVTRTGNQFLVNKDRIALRVGELSEVKAVNTSSTDHQAQINMYTTRDSTTNAIAGVIDTKAQYFKVEASPVNGNPYDTAGNRIEIGNQDLRLSMKQNQIYLGLNDGPGSSPESVVSDTRTVLSYGHVDVKDANFKVFRDGNSIFSIRGNNNRETEDTFKEWAGDVNTTNHLFNDDLTHPTGEGNPYDVAIHGSAIIGQRVTDTSGNTTTYVQLATGHRDTSAAVNIVRNENYTNKYMEVQGEDGPHKESYKADENIVFIDQGATGNDQNNEDSAGIGTIYIRKGLIAINPVSDMSWYSGSASHEIDDSIGTIKAARFVANNQDNGNAAIVPKLFSDKTFNEYNGKSGTQDRVRYDTYMVNPAYTSVMHDIKLTTRGGARLSDVLPDFINKGIYIVNNTYKDNIKNLAFTGAIKGNKVVALVNGTEEPTSLTGGSFALGEEGSWASPFMGTVPAPQCPPGYGRVITISPVSMMMAQAGIPHLNKEGVPQKYYIMPDANSVSQVQLARLYTGEIPSSSSGSTGENNTTPGFREVSVTLTSSTPEHPSIGFESAIQTEENGAKKSLELNRLSGVKVGETVFAGGVAGQSPLMFQQSTWLKAHAIPLVEEEEMTIDTTSTKYTIGWAALMGFLYPAAYYKEFINPTYGRYSGDNDTGVFWNVFPVMRKSLEGYATVYCYFDRNNIYGMFSDEAPKYIDVYNQMMYADDGWVKKEGGSFDSTGGALIENTNNGYIQRLNDPALKYNEIW